MVYLQIPHRDANLSEEFHLHTLRRRARDGHVQLRSVHLNDCFPNEASFVCVCVCVGSARPQALPATILLLPGLFMAMQPKIIACGNSVAAITMAIRFLLGPVVTAATSAAVGLRGTLLCIAIVQVTAPMLLARTLRKPKNMLILWVHIGRPLCHKELCLLCSPRNTTCTPPFFAPGNI
jgi:hypothetical protein